MNGDLVVTGIT